MSEKTVDDLVNEVAAGIGPTTSLHDVARQVWASSALTDMELRGLENVAFSILIEDGEPREYPAGERVMAMVRGGGHYDRSRLTDDDRERLAYLGFLALAADTIAGDR